MSGYYTIGQIMSGYVNFRQIVRLGRVRSRYFRIGLVMSGWLRL